MIPYGKQSISDEDIKAVVDVLKSDWLTQGPKVPEFEQAVAEYVNVKHAVAVNSATSALHIACLALGVTKADEVWTSPNSFVASANCALYCGASIDFVDIDLSTGNMCLNALEAKLKARQQTNQPLPKVVIPVHFAGQPCDMDTLHTLSVQYGFKVIEDASHAIGGTYLDSSVGSCTYSDITVFSFHPVKIMTSAEGGIATTNCKKLARKMQLLRSHGVTNLESEMTESSHGPWYYQQIELGFNYRLTDLQAALGISQLTRVKEFVTKRNQMAENYLELLKQSNDIIPLAVKNDRLSAFHLFVVRLPNLNHDTHAKVVTYLRAQGVFAHVHYIPIHLQPYYQQLGFKKGDYPNAELYYQQAITLPLYPELTMKQQTHVISALNNAIKEYC
ncbi:UDP-4-amino-4,6-dideoxy-N-acetyl-beta-L-altrosamine transaminase [Pseudoalteromonas xiamenensis]|uniref:UDP-4-amino-4, 6-dideoxy-N-acetyl-beta-L-altrosamine transaminase n=1 Tax=Pseudoalteromonas xiamenensis TaxID=882626 RepID=A0A975DFT6_9GAMM|nr:UDP-4-amino-4,6-dideoxy-N-acetyl-beta-L-altrosamine transaminase [Pseudoalteromonas xiamenensis]QTH71056.1 UDP-4-amino-4,6-dideoxy-N-acetyl-beta-L-altrosamine transaminase [Pseudoalteromonas xiamenensis]